MKECTKEEGLNKAEEDAEKDAEKECKKVANKLFNEKYQEIYSMCIKEGSTQEDAKIKAREEANLVKNQSLKECMGTAD